MNASHLYCSLECSKLSKGETLQNQYGIIAKKRFIPSSLKLDIGRAKRMKPKMPRLL